MTHRLDPVRDLPPAQHDTVWPWLAFMVLLLTLAILVAIMSPARLTAPGISTTQTVVASAENPELGSFTRWQEVRRAEMRVALLRHNPELRAAERFQIAQIQRQAALLADNPELGAFWYFQAQ